MIKKTDKYLIKWKKFWYYPWEVRDIGWDRKYPMLAKLPKDIVFSRLWHRQISNYTQTQVCHPSAVNDVLLSMVELNVHQRNMAMMLANEIIHGANAADFDYETLQWCRRIAKGIRPGTWFDDSIIKEIPSSLSLLLFYFWSKKLGFWDKSRWLLYADYREVDVELSKFQVTSKQLSLLFGAVFWRVSSIDNKES